MHGQEMTIPHHHSNYVKEKPLHPPAPSLGRFVTVYLSLKLRNQPEDTVYVKSTEYFGNAWNSGNGTLKKWLHPRLESK